MSQSYDQTLDDSDDSHQQDDNVGAGERVRPRTAKRDKTPSQLSAKFRATTSQTEASQETLSNPEISEDAQSSVSSNSFAPSDASNQALTSDSQPSTSRASSRPSSRSATMQKKASRTFVEATEEERRVGEQGRFLLNLFIQEQAEDLSDNQATIIREVCHADKQQAVEAGLTDESLTDIALTLRKIGDDISRNTDLNNFIDKVPMDSTKEVFMKVCKQIFQDGDLNWGRVVALFYFAYRLIMRAITYGYNSLPWIRDLIQWAGDFLVKHVAKWILSRGGWKMIKEWFGPSNQTWMMLFFASLTFGLWAYFRKD